MSIAISDSYPEQDFQGGKNPFFCAEKNTRKKSKSTAPVVLPLSWLEYNMKRQIKLKLKIYIKQERMKAAQPFAQMILTKPPSMSTSPMALLPAPTREAAPVVPKVR